MAEHQSKGRIVTSLRAGAMRKADARAVAEAAGGPRESEARLAQRTVTRLRTAADRLEGQVRRTTRSEAAERAARTRTRRADDRSTAARKGARTRSAKRS